MRRTTPFAILLLLAAGACGPAELVVNVEVMDDSTEGTAMARALPDLEIQLIPYDRDAVFDSLETAYGTPEPEIPQDILDQQTAVQAAQARWRQAEERWNVLRDTLQTISQSLKQYSRGEARYVALFREFTNLEGEYTNVERRKDQAFEEFNALQRGSIQRADSMRIQRANWADEAFAGAGDVFLMKTRASGLDMAVDTTDSSGLARIEAKPGTYWVHARYELPYRELYWNVMVTLERGEPTQLTLTRENAQERIKL